MRELRQYQPRGPAAVFELQRSWGFAVQEGSSCMNRLMQRENRTFFMEEQLGEPPQAVAGIREALTKPEAVDTRKSYGFDPVVRFPRGRLCCFCFEIVR
jgi:hypothetical protein